MNKNIADAYKRKGFRVFLYRLHFWNEKEQLSAVVEVKDILEGRACTMSKVVYNLGDSWDCWKVENLREV